MELGVLTHIPQGQGRQVSVGEREQWGQGEASEGLEAVLSQAQSPVSEKRHLVEEVGGRWGT